MNIKAWISQRSWRVVWAALLSLLLWTPVPLLAAVTDIAGEPLASLVSVRTKPNILFVLDNSGSMGWDFMPDDMGSSGVGLTTTYGYKSAQCNGVAYDPTYSYDPPLKDDGSSFPNASFTAAKPNGFGPTLSGGSAYYSNSTVTTGAGSKTFEFTGGLFGGFSNWLTGLPPWSVGDTITAMDVDDDNHWVIGTITSVNRVGDWLCLIYCKATVVINVTSYNGTDTATDWKVNLVQVDNLANSTYYVYNATGSQPKMNWTYTASGAVNTLFKQECLSHAGSSAGEAGDGKFTGVVVTAASSEAQNYANWYQYYRTRMLMMRSAAGRAFQPLTNRYRIGFTTINDTGLTESTVLRTISAGQAFLNVRDYDNAQRALFLERLYNATPNGGTPLRTALSKAGRYFAKKVSGQSYDPVQYACQRNYAFLSTDGYWNDSSNPKQLNGTTDIGQQDAADVRPFSDGGAATATTVSTVTEHRETRTAVTAVQNYTLVNYTYAGTALSKAPGCTTLKPIKRTATPLTSAPSISATRVETADWVTTTTLSTTTTAGVQTSSTVVSAPTRTTYAAVDPIPLAPTVWTAGTASTSCQSAFTSTPATDGGPYPSGSTVVTATGLPTTVVLSTTTDGPTTTVAGGPGGTPNTLADVAEYYYMTDLRTPTLGNCTAGAGGSGDVCDNTGLTASGRDTALWQHMATFTLGLGVNGTLPYDRLYLDHATDSTSSYYKLIKGGTSGLEWPAPVANNATTIDDLWHTAVNGRGQYFGAKNATELTDGLKVALSTMGSVPGAGSSVGVSTLEPTGTNNFAFGSTYATVDWTGNVMAYKVMSDGSISAPLSGTAKAGVDNLALRKPNITDGRTIYYRRPATTTLRSFTYTNLNADSLGANFTNFCSRSVADVGTVYPSQCATLSATQKTAANDGTKLVEWLRGYGAYEETNLANPLFRTRVSALGDIVNSTPVYVGPPSLTYGDTGYAAFKTAQATRQAMVYVGANDGMLHAFPVNASGLGNESWAFVPTAVMPNLFRMANTDYASRHQYSVDGTPAIGDIQVAGVWKTILVGGLNSGGKGIYALDITNPSSPQLLWEFTDTDLGYTYGKPIITKRADGTWVVVFASGHNNTGNGYLYVRNANTGAQEVAKIQTYTSGTTAAGTAASPSGLASLNAWVDSVTDNTAKRFYGGDLKGNVWRFDIDNLTAPNGQAQRLAYLQNSDGTPQSITKRPMLAEVDYLGIKYPVVMVGTGRYLGETDLSDKTQQAIYAIKDPLTATDWGNVRADARMIAQSVTTVASDKKRIASTSAVNWASGIGWRVDMTDKNTNGVTERMTADMLVQFTTLVVGTGVPGVSTTCSPSGGTGWVYYLDIATGGTLQSASDIARFNSSGMVMGLTWQKLPNGKSRAVGSGSDGSLTGIDVPTNSSGGAGTLRRASWRELFNN
ncbi:MAG: PilC/PilY family type IV pilus protein [Pseudomonadota bacterium]